MTAANERTLLILDEGGNLVPDALHRLRATLITPEEDEDTILTAANRMFADDEQMRSGQRHLDAWSFIPASFSTKAESARYKSELQIAGITTSFLVHLQQMGGPVSLSRAQHLMEVHAGELDAHKSKFPGATLPATARNSIRQGFSNYKNVSHIAAAIEDFRPEYLAALESASGLIRFLAICSLYEEVLFDTIGGPVSLNLWRVPEAFRVQGVRLDLLPLEESLISAARDYAKP